MKTPASVHPALCRVRQRVTLALFLSAFAQATLVCSLVLAVTMLAGRVLGPPALVAALAPNRWWLVVGALPFAWAIWRVGHDRTSDGCLRAWLDHALELRSLLLAAGEVDAGAWQGQLDRRLNEAGAVRPSLAWRALALRALPGLLFLGVVLLLPPPAKPPLAHGSRAKEQALAELRERLEDRQEQGVLSEQHAEELGERLHELDAALAQHGDVSWNDVDAAMAKLDQLSDAHTASLERAARELERLASGASQSADPQASLARMAEQLARQGALSTLPQSARDALQAAGLGSPAGKPDASPSPAIDAGKLPRSPAALAKLAQALAEAARQQLSELSKAGLVDAKELADLNELVAQAGQAPPPLAHEHTPACAGGT